MWFLVQRGWVIYTHAHTHTDTHTHTYIYIYIYIYIYRWNYPLICQSIYVLILLHIFNESYSYFPGSAKLDSNTKKNTANFKVRCSIFCVANAFSFFFSRKETKLKYKIKQPCYKSYNYQTQQVPIYRAHSKTWFEWGKTLSVWAVEYLDCSSEKG